MGKNHLELGPNPGGFWLELRSGLKDHPPPPQMESDLGDLIGKSHPAGEGWGCREKLGGSGEILGFWRKTWGAEGDLRVQG